MREKEKKLELDVSATLTPEALKWLEALAKDAQQEISVLPEGSQPLWFRLNKKRIVSDS